MAVAERQREVDEHSSCLQGEGRDRKEGKGRVNGVCHAGAN